ncbi:MAG: hypothetical protein P4L99_05840 [Chthoniobacter sp.]|nr:hypothetical protein [Chthoniobacter sp.]
MKILLLGSHPSALNIIPFRHRLTALFSEIFAMNNAWDILRGYPQHWLHSSDFNRLGTLLPCSDDRALFVEERENFSQKPKWYQFPETGTMFLNSMYHIYNTYLSGGLREIHVLGCDCDYSDNGKTHFYGVGKLNGRTRKLLRNSKYAGIAADPMRFGERPLRLALDRMVADFSPVAIYTLSANPKQLLPFQYYSLEQLFPDETARGK